MEFSFPTPFPSHGIFECGFGPHQWVGIAVALRQLLPDTFSWCGVAVEAHILWAELQQRWPFSRSWGGWPRVSVNHPGSRVLPRSPAAVQLQRKNACRWGWIHNVDGLFWTRTGTIETLFTLRVGDVIKKACLLTNQLKNFSIFLKNGRKCWDPYKKKCIFGCFHTKLGAGTKHCRVLQLWRSLLIHFTGNAAKSLEWCDWLLQLS